MFVNYYVRKTDENPPYAAGGDVARASLIAVVCLCLLCFAQPAHAAIVWSGDVQPDDPATWTSGTYSSIGMWSNGTLDITDGSDVLGYEVTIGGTNVSTGEVTVRGSGSTWTNGSFIICGLYGSGILNVKDGGAVSSGGHQSYIGYMSSSTCEVTVDGSGSTWTNNGGLLVGDSSNNGTLYIINGGVVSNGWCHIGNQPGSMGEVTVDGAGSMWTNSENLNVGYHGSGILNITDGGLVSIAGDLSIDTNANGGDFINMSTGGMLALFGDADGSLAEFMDLINGTDAIRYWDGSDWADITGATYGDDYTLDCLSGGDLDGYTVLTVMAVPEPSTFVMLIAGLIGVLIVRRRVARASLIAVVCLCLFCFAQPARAEIAWSGDVLPEYPATWTSDTDAYIGQTENGTMNITGGSDVLARYAYIARGSTGQVMVDGDGSTWTLAIELRISESHDSDGTLTITRGGAVSSQSGKIATVLDSLGSTGRVTVDGVGSTWTNSSTLYVGGHGGGILNVTGGGVVSSAMGSVTGQASQATVNGVGSVWTMDYGFEVGGSTLDITAGGAVSNGYSAITSSPGSTSQVTVDGAGSTWTNTGTTQYNDGHLYVGHFGNGTLNITNGGSVVSSSRCLIGYLRDSTGIVTVDGAGSTWTNNGDLAISGYYSGFGGSNSNGTLNITDGGLVSVAGILTVNYYGNDESFINMSSGGMLALYGDAAGSLDDFIGLIQRGTGAIRYWDGSDWADITGATYGDDYTLDYLSGGDLDGYTMLTVGTVPEPSTFVMLIAGLIGVLVVRRRGG